jgi:hypothetical protein
MDKKILKKENKPPSESTDIEVKLERPSNPGKY